jgi:membrane-associated protein
MDFLHHPLLILKPEGIRFIIEAFGLWAVCLVVFAESGVFPTLPGDSLLVVCGIYAATPAAGTPGALSLWALLTVVPLCGILGSQIGFAIGHWAGPAAYRWKDRNWGPLPVYRVSWLVKTEDFFKRWGAFAVVAARWVPFVRTGAPLLAGVTKMPYRSYVPYNIAGAVSWVWSMVLVGYFLPPLVNPFVDRFIPGFQLQDRIDVIIVVVVALSCLPIVYATLKESGLATPAPKSARTKSAAKSKAKTRRR